VIQAGNYAKALGVVELGIDKATGQVVASSSRLVRNDENGIQPDPVVAKMVDRFHAAVAPRTEKVVTNLAAPLVRKLTPSGEMPLGAVIADAQRAFAKTQIAFMNNGGVRQDLDTAGPLTWGKLFGVQPFANIITSFEMTGADIKAVLEEQFRATGEAYMLQASGLKMHVDPTKPAGQRITQITLVDGTPIDPAKTYTVAANSFLADGGDGFASFKKSKKKRELGVDLDALVQYMSTNKAAAAPPAAGRIVVDAGQLNIGDP
jgi:2',3'-cyclic-nucleotide 2'-phosphodiesterase (5'-nucleotidase family)